MGDSLPGAEHLLLSALELPDGSARRTFERVGADPDRLDDAIAEVHAGALRSVGIEPPEQFDDDEPLDAPKGAYRSNASARAAFQAASDMARSGEGGLRGAHVVAAVADMERGTAARALDVMGVDRAALAASAREEAA